MIPTKKVSIVPPGAIPWVGERPCGQISSTDDVVTALSGISKSVDTAGFSVLTSCKGNQAFDALA